MGSHAKHEAPLVPHCAAVVGVTQLLPLQQPVAQLVELQPVQACAVQVNPPPHAAQAAPPVPHSALAVPALQTFPAQQPVGHEVASQTHTPAEQAWPAAQGGPEPQAQAPLVQRSDFASHAEHVAPPLPQAAALCPAVERQVLPLQQPFGHELALQTQVPPEQVWPAPQAGPAPQRQTPELQVLVDPEQGPHAAPPVPQLEALWLPKATHTPALQQPLGHEVESHTQVPPRHRCPLAHAAPAPHWQVPRVAEQRSAVAPQLVQAAPVRPHWLWVVGLTQVVPLQQPLAHELELQTHAPATHDWPALQAAPPPQRQAPLVQLSAVALLQAVHTAPDVPQAPSDGVWQVPFEQQPVAQLAALQPEHVCAVQVCPPGQAWQATPPVPQAAVWLPAWQVLPMQQPLGQLAALHTQAPPTHAWPATQAGPAPHWQVPLAQLSERVALQAEQLTPAVPQRAAVGVRQVSPSQHPLGQLWASHTHAPPWQRWPAAQAAPVPHPQLPPVQVSVPAMAQVAQTAPAVPHMVFEVTWQAPLKQQPEGQLLLSQPAQVPDSHALPAAQV